MVDIKDYKKIRSDYNLIKDNHAIDKNSEYYTSVDTSSGSYQEGSKIAGKIINDLQLLDQRRELCISAQVKLKHNNHDFGSYYSIEVYTVELSVDDDNDLELISVVDKYSEAGRDQLESILKKYYC